MMARTLTLAAAAFALSAGLAQASPGWTSSGVNFREGPGTWHPVITYLPRCAPVEVGRHESGWAYVEWQGRWGWVAQNYVRASDAHCQPGYQGGHTGGGQRPRY